MEAGACRSQTEPGRHFLDHVTPSGSMDLAKQASMGAVPGHLRASSAHTHYSASAKRHGVMGGV
jgi:hypothetical protein